MTTFRHHFSRWFRLPVVLSLALACLQVRAAERTWSFVVMGDTRDLTRATRTGISPELNDLARAIAAEKPDLVIHTGDLINGYFTTHDSPMHRQYKRQLANWKAAVQPIYDYGARTGIPIYPVRGNHEDGEIVTDTALRQAYLDEIGVTLPQDGPEQERGLTYSVTHKGARFFALDGYREKQAAVVRGYVDQAWLDAQLAAGSPPFVFAYSHTPAFAVGKYGQSPFPDLYSHPARRDALWSSLVRGGAVAYFCGHIHLYTRGTVAGMEQVVVGNGGANVVGFDAADVDPRIAVHFPRQGKLDAANVRTGYLLMTVDEGARTVSGTQKTRDPATRAWVAGDTFTLRLR